MKIILAISALVAFTAFVFYLILVPGKVKDDWNEIFEKDENE
jgi:hypothetical protein